MGHPKKLFNDYNGETYVPPYPMTETEQAVYNRYMFEREQYYALTNYLSTPQPETVNREKIDETTGEKTAEEVQIPNTTGEMPAMDKEIFGLLQERSASLSLYGKAFISETQKAIDGALKDPQKELDDAEKKLKTAIELRDDAKEEVESCKERLAEDKASTEYQQDLKNAEKELKEKERMVKEAEKELAEPQKKIDEVGKDFKNHSEVLYSANLDVQNAFKDISCMEKVEEDHLPSYTSMHRSADSVKIELPEEALDNVKKGAMSSRIPINYMDEHGLLHKGFFTKESDQSSSDNNIGDLMKTAGIELGRNANYRNNAMSDMATLLGMGDILAKSTNMTVQIGEEEFTGTFMDYADGYMSEDIKPDDPFFEGKELQVDYNKVCESNFNMMILDYICLNVDRHAKNFSYRFKKDEQGNPTLVGFQGIDNDFSFGTKTFIEKGQSIGYLSSLEEIDMIPEKTARFVMGITKDAVCSILARNELQGDEISACWERVSALQERIRDKKITVSEKFDKSNYDAYASTDNFLAKSVVTPMAYFESIRTGELIDMGIAYMGGSDNNYKKRLDEHRENYAKREAEFVNEKLKEFREKNSGKKLTEDHEKKAEKIIKNAFAIQEKNALHKKEMEDYVKTGIRALGSKIVLDSNCTVRAQAKRLDKLVNRFWSPKEKDIPEYKELYDSVHQLNERMKSFGSGKKPLNDMQQNLLAEEYKNVQKAINKYIPAISITTKRNDLKRIGIAESIMDVCIIGIGQREREVNEFNDSMAAAMRQLSTAEKQYKAALEVNPNGIDCLMAKKILNAKIDLSGRLGNWDKPTTPEDKLKTQKDILTMALSQKLKDFQVKEPSDYQLFAENIENKPGQFGEIIEKLSKEAVVSKLLSEVRPGAAMLHHVENAVLEVDSKLNLFEPIIKQYCKVLEKPAKKEIQNQNEKLDNHPNSIEKKAESPKLCV